MDNAPVHRGAVCGAHKVKFLPAHSSFLNPIENVFGVFKLKDHVIQQLLDVSNNISNVEHRILVFRYLAIIIMEDHEVLGGPKVENMCTHVMQYMHSFAMADTNQTTSGTYKMLCILVSKLKLLCLLNWLHYLLAKYLHEIE